ncbi:MAG: type II toxin-antitoxin system VapC family toxin [Anaerolineae bacterium]
MIIDASVILRAFFPDEEQAQAQALIRDHVSGRLQLVAPTLLVYEVTNAVVQAVRQERIGDQAAEEILGAFEGLDIHIEPVGWQQILPLSLRFGRSAYDAAYLALAQERGEPLVTGDLRLYRVVHEHLPWVRCIG